MNKLSHYLEAYYKIQPDILLCYRPKNEGQGSSWSDRCLFKEEGYSATKKYNHRITLDKEVVIEFDEPNPEDNKRVADIVVQRLKRDGMKYSMWFSGSKSYHVHLFIDPRQASNLRLLKSVIMRHYCKDLEFKPDLQLAGKHLIRAEYGLNEKTGVNKYKVGESRGYPVLNEIPKVAWSNYIKEMGWLMKADMTRSVSELANSSLIKKLLDTTYFNDKMRDGRERILFILSNVLVAKYEKKELVELLQKWYKYTNGRKLTDGQIAYKVYKAFSKPYTISEKYILQTIQELEL
jgi:hypothetical protein